MNSADTSLPSEADKWQRRFEREREARHTAEEFLELRSRELYSLNSDLEQAKDELERRVSDRTKALQKAVEGLRDEALRRRATEKKLRKARDAALEAVHLKSDFLARMSHEIRTPLNAIIGLTGLMNESDLSQKHSRNLETVRTSSQLLLRIVNDILDMSKIEAGTLDLEYTNENIDTLLRQSFSLMLLPAQEKSIELVQQNFSALPENAFLDGGRLQQILTNLLSNAIKYCDSGTITLQVELEALDSAPEIAALLTAVGKTNGGWKTLKITVADEGAGIPIDQLESLFESFSRLEREKDEHAAGSAGLGLAICRGLCELMGGRIDASSKLLHGSQFTVQIPCFVPDSKREAIADANYLETTNMTALHETNFHLLSNAVEQTKMQDYDNLGHRYPLSILIADDYDINRMVLESQLESLGYRADGVANGEEALRALHARDYDIVFMDIRMPVLDGVEATRRIRAHHKQRQPYIAAVTASALKGDRERYLDAGMDGYVAKPVDIVKLAQLLEKAYKKVHTKREARWDDTLVDLQPAKIHLEELRKRLGPATDVMLAKVAPVYLRELPGRLEKLQSVLTAKSVEQFGQICHGLKGTSKSVGALDLAEMCFHFEKMAADGQLPKQSELHELSELAERTALALKNILKI